MPYVVEKNSILNVVFIVFDCALKLTEMKMRDNAIFFFKCRMFDMNYFFYIFFKSL